MNDFAEEALTDEHMQRLQHDSEIGCKSRYAGAGEESGGIEAYASESYEDEAPRKSTPKGDAVWGPDGEPENLAAAIIKVLAWLRILRTLVGPEPSTNAEIETDVAALIRFGVKDVR